VKIFTGLFYAAGARRGGDDAIFELFPGRELNTASRSIIPACCPSNISGMVLIPGLNPSMSC